MTHLLSIIIPTYNAAPYLDDCLRSLAPQLAPDIEIIVQDGGSRDSTPEILSAHRDMFARVDVRRDDGQSDAIDQGIRYARGRFVTWLNADDVLMPGALAIFRRATIRKPNTEWWVGSTVVLDHKGRIKSATRAGPMVYTPWLRFVATYGPSSIFTKRLYESAGGLDLSFHYMMDTDLWYRFAGAGFRYERLPGYLWGFRQHEGSKTTAHLFSQREYDPFTAAEAPKTAERMECNVRYSTLGGGHREKFAQKAALALRIVEGSLPHQMVEGREYRNKLWSEFVNGS